MWVKFTHDFYWSPPERGNRVRIWYKTGMTIFVRRACAEEALRKGVAEKTVRPYKWASVN